MHCCVSKPSRGPNHSSVGESFSCSTTLFPDTRSCHRAGSTPSFPYRPKDRERSHGQCHKISLHLWPKNGAESEMWLSLCNSVTLSFRFFRILKLYFQASGPRLFMWSQTFGSHMVLNDYHIHTQIYMKIHEKTWHMLYMQYWSYLLDIQYTTVYGQKH